MLIACTYKDLIALGVMGSLKARLPPFSPLSLCDPLASQCVQAVKIGRS